MTCGHRRRYVTRGAGVLVSICDVRLRRSYIVNASSDCTRITRCRCGVHADRQRTVGHLHGDERVECQLSADCQCNWPARANGLGHPVFSDRAWNHPLIEPLVHWATRFRESRFPVSCMTCMCSVALVVDIGPVGSAQYPHIPASAPVRGDPVPNDETFDCSCFLWPMLAVLILLPSV
jgi:hypothetical protein